MSKPVQEIFDLWYFFKVKVVLVKPELLFHKKRTMVFSVINLSWVSIDVFGQGPGQTTHARRGIRLENYVENSSVALLHNIKAYKNI